MLYPNKEKLIENGYRIVGSDSSIGHIPEFESGEISFFRLDGYMSIVDVFKEYSDRGIFPISLHDSLQHIEKIKTINRSMTVWKDEKEIYHYYSFDTWHGDKVFTTPCDISDAQGKFLVEPWYFMGVKK